MYRNILIPMALDHGVGAKTLDIAKTLLAEGGTITALHVYETPPGTYNSTLDEKTVQQAYDRAKSILEERVADMPGVKAIMLKGHVGRTITEYAAEHGHDCIVMGSHKPGLSDYFLGSTAARVVRHALCAVHVHRSEN